MSVDAQVAPDVEARINAPVKRDANGNVIVDIKDILEDLVCGLTRDQIGERYGFSKAEVRMLFKHPKLKNKKTRKRTQVNFVLTDSTDGEVDLAEVDPVLKQAMKDQAAANEEPIGDAPGPQSEAGDEEE